ncbi:Hypothetical protein PHPALM_7467 [Phytophthora palmivora]|uniref:Secreted RxLR effector peptide protein n=1 Tax=Phytophthora palmivora TaxID=4796 RepID=A0A2P4YC87_9STRA|nr:Hypothetical protein PHPALM_7467 [Phytophthora palmivora]
MRLTSFLVLFAATFVVVSADSTGTKSVFFTKSVDSAFRRLRMSTDVQEERGTYDEVAKLILGLKGSGHDSMAKLQKIFANLNPALKATDEEVAKVSTVVKKANTGAGVGLTDDEVTKLAKTFASAQKSAQLTDDQVSKLSKMFADAKRVKEAGTVSDDEVTKLSEMIKKASAGAGGAKFTDDELATVSKVFAAGQKQADLSDDQVSKVSKMFSEADMADDAFKATDDAVARMSDLVKKANGGDGVGLTDDEVAALAKAFASTQKSAQLTDDQVSKLSKMFADAKKLDDVAKISDNEVAKVTEMLKKVNAGATGRAKFNDDQVTNMARAFATAQKGAGLSDDQVNNLAKLFTEAKKANKISDKSIAKLSQELLVVAQKDKKSWFTMERVIAATLGAIIGGTVIHIIREWMSRDSPTPTAAISATSTTGSA